MRRSSLKLNSPGDATTFSLDVLHSWRNSALIRKSFHDLIRFSYGAERTARMAFVHEILGQRASPHSASDRWMTALSAASGVAEASSGKLHCPKHILAAPLQRAAEQGAWQAVLKVWSDLPLHHRDVIVSAALAATDLETWAQLSTRAAAYCTLQDVGDLSRFDRFPHLKGKSDPRRWSVCLALAAAQLAKRYEESRPPGLPLAVALVEALSNDGRIDQCRHVLRAQCSHPLHDRETAKVMAGYFVKPKDVTALPRGDVDVRALDRYVNRVGWQDAVRLVSGTYRSRSEGHHHFSYLFEWRPFTSTLRLMGDKGGSWTVALRVVALARAQLLASPLPTSLIAGLLRLDDVPPDVRARIRTSKHEALSDFDTTCLHVETRRGVTSDRMRHTNWMEALRVVAQSRASDTCASELPMTQLCLVLYRRFHDDPVALDGVVKWGGAV